LGWRWKNFFLSHEMVKCETGAPSSTSYLPLDNQRRGGFQKTHLIFEGIREYRLLEQFGREGKQNRFREQFRDVCRFWSSEANEPHGK